MPSNKSTSIHSASLMKNPTTQIGRNYAVANRSSLPRRDSSHAPLEQSDTAPEYTDADQWDLVRHPISGRLIHARELAQISRRKERVAASRQTSEKRAQRKRNEEAWKVWEANQQVRETRLCGDQRVRDMAMKARQEAREKAKAKASRRPKTSKPEDSPAS